MMSNAFEAAFDAFLERREYDEAQQAQFALVRAAFLAGWLASFQASAAAGAAV